MTKSDLYGTEEAPVNIHDINHIVLSRILDVLYSMYLEQNEEQAKALIDLHASGGFITPMPQFSLDEMVSV